MEEILRYLETSIIQRHEALNLAEKLGQENAKLKQEVEQLQSYLNPKIERKYHPARSETFGDDSDIPF